MIRYGLPMGGKFHLGSKSSFLENALPLDAIVEAVGIP